LINAIYGKKGAGKTKRLIDTANSLASKGPGQVVFIDDSSKHIYDLKHEVRFVNVSEYGVKGTEGLKGFICGIISTNYDISSIIVDRLIYITAQKPEAEEMERLLRDLETISAANNIDFYLSISGDPESMPEYMKKYV